MNLRHLGYFILVLIVLIAGVNAIALANYLYWIIGWFDIPMHIVGGFWVGLTALWMYHVHHRTSDVLPISAKKIVLISLVATVVIGLMWEIFEFGVDAFIVILKEYDIVDTIGDLISDIIGALLAAYFFYLVYQRGTETIAPDEINDPI